ncbi:hypothetical protein G9C98_007450 [Cotesia typhae]|uniref:AAA+ ATPase domain-containing protein n=1 Tax=Cotesia typhae TaxID=2053667 RepID=A0A8J5R8U8_9HYME|nr:hypothetical protein G9C98_007450 [Cotesia typhae]
MSLADGGTLSRYEIFSLVAKLSLITAFGFFGMRWMINQIDPITKTRKKTQEKAREQLAKLGITASIDTYQLTEYEMLIAANLIDPKDIPVSWNNIGGLDTIIQELKETVILPIRRKKLFEDSKLTQAPKGVLLHGPPGCGKTMIAKATARESGTCFINLDVGMLTDKWYGESQKLTNAVFSLAVKLQPCIIFIDEIDSFLRVRSSQDHEATAMMKAQFMSLWDGLITDPSCTVIIMGATNRPKDLDRAILRRLPATFHVGLPTVEQRTEILKLILKTEPIDTDVDIDKLSKLTEGFSGSDLHEMCRTASLYRVRDYSREHPNSFHDMLENAHSDETLVNTNSNDEEYHDTLRPIVHNDLMTAFEKMRISKVKTGSLNNMSRFDLD